MGQQNNLSSIKGGYPGMAGRLPTALNAKKRRGLDMLHKSRDNPPKKPRFLIIMNRKFIKGSGLTKKYQINNNPFSSYLQGKNELKELNTDTRGGQNNG
jgi:hypothetical protein